MNKQYEIEVDSNTIHVSRKKIKNMYLRIKKDDARIEVSAPLKMKDAQIIAFIKSRRDWINDAKARAEKLMEKENDIPVLAPFQERELRYALKKRIEELIARWEPVMHVKSNGFTIKKMKTRWGSCNVRTHHMTFNLALAHIPYECLEYVVVHELSHLIEPSHNERFWRTMETYLPDAKLRRKKLKGYSV